MGLSELNRQNKLRDDCNAEERRGEGGKQA
jgi:hypothetical protein